MSRSARELIVADVSFISVAKILPALIGVAEEGAIFLILVKPQFELERGEIGKGGIVRDPQLHQKAIERVREAAITAGLKVLGVRASRVAGAEGNQEFFLHARQGLKVQSFATNARKIIRRKILAGSSQR